MVFYCFVLYCTCVVFGISVCSVIGSCAVQSAACTGPCNSFNKPTWNTYNINTLFINSCSFLNTYVLITLPVLQLRTYTAPEYVYSTQLSIPTHAQLQRHRLKFTKNHLKKLLHISVYDHLQGVYNVLAKITIVLTTF